MKFEGTKDYVATEDLRVAVNAAITLQRPLLVKGEPGTGKTVLAEEVAKALDAELITWHIKSTTKAHQGLYEYDAVSRLRDSQLGDERVHDIRNYISKGKLWEAFERDKRPILLIDEIDKADIEFPNGLLQELDRMEFHVYETGETIEAVERPVVIITSNNEKELPDAFLRRCFFHFIAFPDEEMMRAIVNVHFPGLKSRLLAEALKLFYEHFVAGFAAFGANFFALKLTHLPVGGAFHVAVLAFEVTFFPFKILFLAFQIGLHPVLMAFHLFDHRFHFADLGFGFIVFYGGHFGVQAFGVHAVGVPFE